MTATKCLGRICFEALRTDGPKFFGITEFIGGLALMILAWSIADVRYRFRVRTAPLPLVGATYYVIAADGILTLLTDWWRAQGWYVPSGSVFTPATWQFILAAVFLGTFLTWTWFAFIRPAKFGRFNAISYARQIYQRILVASPQEIPVVADELIQSAAALIEFSPEMKDMQKHIEESAQSHRFVDRFRLWPKTLAYDILQMIADRRFCKIVVASSPHIALALFTEMAGRKKFGVPLNTFAKNITSEAIANKDSFVYQEIEGYQTGWIGYNKPLTLALYGNFAMVDALDQVFDVDYRERQKWDSEQWEAFGRLLLMTFENYIDNKAQDHSFVIHRGFGVMQEAIRDLYKIDGISANYFEQEVAKRLQVVVNFATKAIDILSNRPLLNGTVLRYPDDVWAPNDIYSLVARTVYVCVQSASLISKPIDTCWGIQYVLVWSHFFNFGVRNSMPSRVIFHKVRRLIFRDIKRTNSASFYKGARLLGMALNVMGFSVRPYDESIESLALHRAVLKWTKRNYLQLVAKYPMVAQAALVDGITFEPQPPHLSRRYVGFIDNEPRTATFDLAPKADLPK